MRALLRAGKSAPSSAAGCDRATDAQAEADADTTALVGAVTTADVVAITAGAAAG